MQIKKTFKNIQFFLFCKLFLVMVVAVLLSTGTSYAQDDGETTVDAPLPTARLEARQNFLSTVRQNSWKKPPKAPDVPLEEQKILRHQHLKNYGDTLDLPDRKIGKIEISIKKQQVYIYDTQGNLIITSETVTGRPGWDTPRGTHTLKFKRKSWVMKGDVWRYGKHERWSVFTNYASYFTNQGHALHDIKRKRFGVGSTGSHGCANLPLAVARYIYNNAPIGTQVRVF